jgi:hypothetical protein
MIDKLGEYFDPLVELSPSNLPTSWPASQAVDGDGKWTAFLEGVYNGRDVGQLETKTRDYAILGVWPS